MKTLIAILLTFACIQTATAANWWDEWTFVNQWVDHHGWWGPANGGDGHPQGFRTCPGSHDAPFKFVRHITIQSGVNSTLHFEATTSDNGSTYGPKADWWLRVVVDGQFIYAKTVVELGGNGNGWTSYDIDLSSYSGKTIQLELWNAMTETDWYDWAMWDNVGFTGSGGIAPQALGPADGGAAVIPDTTGTTGTTGTAGTTGADTVGAADPAATGGGCGMGSGFAGGIAALAFGLYSLLAGRRR